MEQVVNLTQEDVNEIAQNFELQPRHRDVIITVNTWEELDEEGITLSDNSFSDTQFVVAVGENIRDLEPGQKVLLNIEALMVNTPSLENVYESQAQIKIFPVNYKGRMYALVSDNVIKIKDNRNE